MSTSAVPPQLNGNNVVPAEGHREADFLEKLLQIRDEVLAGKHPRIRLPPKVLEQVAPRSSHGGPPARPTTNGTPNGSASSHLLPPRPDSSLQQFPSPNEFASPGAHAARPFSAKSASSGIDPVLLTKSDHLIRAEIQLKRQQVERTLKDQWDKKARINDEEREVLDVEDLLAQAQRLVKPVSGLRTPATNSDGVESFDENSYYSSKADSWSPEEVDRNQNTSADAAESLTLQGKRSGKEVQLTSTKIAPVHQADTAVIDLDEEPYEPADDIEIYEPEPASAQDEAEESDYSPPPADIGPSEPRRGRGRENHGGVNGYGVDTFLMSSVCLFPFSLFSKAFPSHAISYLVYTNPSTVISLRPSAEVEREVGYADYRTDPRGAIVHQAIQRRSRTIENARGRKSGVNRRTSVSFVRLNQSLRKNRSRPLPLLHTQIRPLSSGVRYNPLPMM